MNNTNRLRLTSFATVVALGGCGGGDNSAPQAQAADTTAVPSSAAESALAYIEFQRSMAVSDVIEPLSLRQFLPPTDDTAEPQPIS